jgi:hypothetical protein
LASFAESDAQSEAWIRARHQIEGKHRDDREEPLDERLATLGR